MNPSLFHSTPHERRRLLRRESELRASGAWGEWLTIEVLPGVIGGNGWTRDVSWVARNAVFAVLRRDVGGNVVHLAVSSLSGNRPTWWEMQRIKNELAGSDLTAVEVYPPQAEVVDGADMFHIWVLPEAIPFSLCDPPRPPPPPEVTYEPSRPPEASTGERGEEGTAAK